MSGALARLARQPLLASPFRVFYLLGALYAPALAIGGVLAFRGAVDLDASGGSVLWHGHEMLFGFAGAIIIGTLLTALPSWAGIAELHGLPLAALALAWALGRIVFWSAPWLPWHALAALDLLPWLGLAFGLVVPLARVRNRLYLLTLPILAAFVASDAVHLYAAAHGDPVTADQALRAMVWAILMLYSLKGGVLTPIFTGNALRALGRGDQLPFRFGLEALALLLAIALAVADVRSAPGPLTGTLALACLAVHGWRVARWQGWRVADQPLLPAMHVGFLWMLLAFALHAAADFGLAVPPAAWLHAFTVGALGMMMLSLMTRVSLRHTGRVPAAPLVMRAAAWVMTLAALLRVCTALHWVGPGGIAVSILMWALCFAVYLARFGAILLAPSLPRGAEPDGS